MEEDSKEKDKKDLVVIGTTPLYIWILEAIIKSIVSFVTFKFLTVWWEKWKDYRKAKEEKSD